MITSNDTAIICILSTAGAIAGEALDVTVKVLNRGYAFVRADAGETTDFVLKPSVAAVLPRSGSQAGGTLVTIIGDGFSYAIIDNVVQIGSTACDVESSSFNYIDCRTRASVEQAQQVIVTVSGSESECVADDSADCEYTFALDRTPVVTLVSPANIESPYTEFRFKVSRLPSSAADDVTVTVTVGNEVCSVTEVLSQLVKCVLPGVVFGSHKIVIHVSGKGNAEFDSVSDVVESKPLVSTVSPSQSSKHGGLIITIRGNGFNPGKTTVTIGSENCDIITVSYGVIECVTPPHPLSTAAVIQVTVDSGEVLRRRRNAGGVFPTITMAFTQAVTPVVTSISPRIGYGGDVLTINGSGLNPDPAQDEVEVQIGDVSCAVISSEDDHVVCTLAVNAAGSYPVDVVVPGKGRATSGAYFEYILQIDSVDPDQSGFGGGRLLVIRGQGFDESAVVTICGNECTHNPDHITTTTEISCEAPSHALRNIDQMCDIVIGFIANLTDAFTYKPEMTSQITSVTPSRGGTGGGTTLTIHGSGFSNTQSDNIVTIDGVECNVTYANSSLITCQTGPHNGTIETKVRVEVGSNGKAIDDVADFFYVDVWSSPFTWGGNDPPENGMYHSVHSY